MYVVFGSDCKILSMVILYFDELCELCFVVIK